MRDERPTSLDPAFGIGIGGLLPIAVALALVPLRNVMDSSNVALAMVVAVVAAAVIGGRAAGAFAAVVSVLSFDFFHTRPYLSLRIDSRNDIETAAFLLLIGLIVGTVASQAQKAKASAQAGRSEVRRIYRVAEQVARGDEAPDVILAAQAELTSLLHLKECRFEGPPYGDRLPQMERSGVIAGQQVFRFVKGGFELPDSGIELAVLARGQQVGRFVLVPTPGRGLTLEERVVAVALADQVGGALAGTRPVSPSNGRNVPGA